MTDYEDDSDGELPSISLSQSSGVKTEFSMPPATELAAQREREAAAELELQKLRDAEAAAAAAVEVEVAAAEAAARRRDRAGETLSSGVSALEVTGGICKATERQVEELTAMAAHLPARDAAFLATYARALQEAPGRAAANAITKQVVLGVCAGVSRGAWAPAAPGVCGASAALLTAPPGPRARRALHALLDHVAAAHQVDELIAAARAGLRGAARLLAAHDAERSGARAGADRLAAALLAHAVHDLVHGDAPAGPEPPGPLSAAVAAAARARWRRLPPAARLLLLRAAARALAAGGGGGGGAGAQLLAALAQPLPRAPPRTQLEAECAGADLPLPLRHQVLANVAKLQLLFGLGRAADRQVDEPEKTVDEKSELVQDMIVKKKFENGTVTMTELGFDGVTTKAECEDGIVAQTAPGHELPAEQVQEPADAATDGDHEMALESNEESQNKVVGMTELGRDDLTVQPEVTEDAEQQTEGWRGAGKEQAAEVQPAAMEVEAGAPASPAPRLASRSPPDAAGPQLYLPPSD